MGMPLLMRRNIFPGGSVLSLCAVLMGHAATFP